MNTTKDKPKMKMEQSPRLTILSLGAGVQSTALLLASAQGLLPKLDACIFSDTGWEPRAVYEHLDRIDEEIAKPAGIPIYRVEAGNIRDYYLDPEKHYGSIPLFLRHPDGKIGMGRRTCTTEYKVRPITRQIRTLLGAEPKPSGVPGRVPTGRWLQQWIGISTDEFQRAKDSLVGYVRHSFPLLDLGWDRQQCIEYLTENGFGTTPKSACIGCPFHSNAEWRNLKENYPEEWADAVEFDAALRGGNNPRAMRGEQYLHRSCQPLDAAPIHLITRKEARDAQFQLFDDRPFTCSPFSCEGDERAGEMLKMIAEDEKEEDR